jgi:hypothetical protein
MDWQTDPHLMRIEMERRARNGLIRTAIIWTPLFLASAAGLIWAVLNRLFVEDGGSTWFLVVVLSILTFLFGFQSIQAIRDLIGGPRSTVGMVVRRWARTDSFVMRSHYIRLENKQIFRIDKLFHGDVKEGDRVEVRYYPRTAVVIECEKLPEPGEEKGPDPEAELRRELER